MFEVSSSAYLNAVNTVTQLLDQNTKLQEEIVELRAIIANLESPKPEFDDSILSDNEWYQEMADAGEEVHPTFGRDQKPTSQQKTTNDLYRIAKEKHAKKYANADKIPLYEAQEAEIDKALAEAKVKEPPLEVKLSESKREFIRKSGEAIMQQRTQ